MNLNNLYMSLLVVLFSTNITADGNHSEFNCYSTDPEVGDSALWAGEAIELFSQNKYAESIEVVDACFNVFATEAVTSSASPSTFGLLSPSFFAAHIIMAVMPIAKSTFRPALSINRFICPTEQASSVVLSLYVAQIPRSPVGRVPSEELSEG